MYAQIQTVESNSEWMNAAQTPSFKYGFGYGSTSADTGEDLATDAQGNLISTGLFSGTTDFDPDPSGTFNLTSAGLDDIYVAKYDMNGNFLWAVGIGGTGSDYGHGVAVDQDGNILVTGYFENTVDFDHGAGVTSFTSAGGEDIFVLKLDENGVFQWAFSIGGDENDAGHDIDVDPSGNVYITGGFAATADFDPGPGVVEYTSEGHLDIYVAKYDPDGNYVWAFASEGGKANQRGWGITVDDAGNSHISGWFKNNPDVDPGPDEYLISSNGKSDAWLGKYDTNGNFLWAFNIGSGDRDHAFKNALDADGNVYLGGMFRGTVDFDPGPGEYIMSSESTQEAYLAKYDNNGNFIWAFSAGHVGISETSQLLAVASDPAGNAIITGLFVGAVDLDPGPGVFELTGDGSNDAYVASYSPAGELNWAFPIEGSGTDIGQGVATDDFGNVFATGVFRSEIDLDGDAATSSYIVTSSGIGDAYIAAYSTSLSQPPSANFTYIEDDLFVSFDGSSSTDDGSIVSWDWNFGDGNMASGEFTSHTFADPGVYTVVLTVTDNDGTSGTASQTIEIGNIPPVASFSHIQTVGTLDVYFDGSGSSDDGSIVSWEWDFGDGNTASGEMVSHTYTASGAYDVMLTVIDNLGASGSTTVNVDIEENQDPVPAFSFTQDTGTLTINFDGSGSSDDGSIVSWEWDFGDSNSGSGQSVSHAYASASTYSVTLIVTDDLGATASLTQEVDVTELGEETMHIESITTVAIRTGGAGIVEATVLIQDQNQNPVQDATVSGTFSGDISGSDSGVTDANGIVILVSDGFSKRVRDLGICVDDVTHATLVYAPEQNTDSSFNCVSDEALLVTKSNADERINKGNLSSDVHSSENSVLPTEYALKGNYPNPFNPTTTISFDLPEASSVRLEVYDMMGRRVATLVNGELAAGSYESVWNARNDAGSPVASGVYIYRIQAGAYQAVQQMVLMK